MLTLKSYLVVIERCFLRMKDVMDLMWLPYMQYLTIACTVSSQSYLMYKNLEAAACVFLQIDPHQIEILTRCCIGTVVL